MTYRPRPFGVGPYGDDVYSQWHQPDFKQTILAGRSSTIQGSMLRDVGFTSSLQARSSARQRIVLDAVVHVGVLMGRSGSIANARLYWEEDPACDTTWVVRPPPPYVCPELEPADG